MDELISAEDAWHGLATVTLVRFARARNAMCLLEALQSWRRCVRDLALNVLVHDHLLPLLECRTHAVLNLRPDPQEYVAFGDASAVGSCEARLLMGELRGAESELQDMAAGNTTGSTSRLGMGVRFFDASSLSSLQDLDVSQSSSPPQPSARSPTPTDFSDTATGFNTPAKFRGRCGLTLKQLSEGNRALSAAVEREMRRAAELAKAKQRLERMDRRMQNVVQQLADANVENARLRAELEAAKCG